MLTLLRLISSSFCFMRIIYMLKNRILNRVTGGMFVLHCSVQLSSLNLIYCYILLILLDFTRTFAKFSFFLLLFYYFYTYLHVYTLFRKCSSFLPISWATPWPNIFMLNTLAYSNALNRVCWRWRYLGWFSKRWWGKPNLGLSIIEQAPLDGYKAPPIPVSFKLLLVVLWWIYLLIKYLDLWLSFVGYPIQDWTLAVVFSDLLRLLL
jgi:hypothetical protein